MFFKSNNELTPQFFFFCFLWTSSVANQWLTRKIPLWQKSKAFLLPSKVLLLVTKKGPRLPKTMCDGARSLENTSKLMFQKKTVSLVGKMEIWYFFWQLKGKSELAFFRCLCTCSVNVQTWKLIFMFAFVSTLFWNTTNVIEIFLYSCDNLTLKILYDVLGLGQTPWWRLCWRSACRISCISTHHDSIQIFLWSWDVHDRHPWTDLVRNYHHLWVTFRTKESFTSSSQIYTRYDMGKCFLRLNFTHVKITLKSLRRPIQK